MNQDEGEAKEESAVGNMKGDDSQEETMGDEEPCHLVEADEDADHEETNDAAEDEEDHRQPMGLRDPGQPSPAERAEHCLTHIPYRSWCAHCVRGKAKGRQSRRLRGADGQDECPRVRFDYCHCG